MERFKKTSGFVSGLGGLSMQESGPRLKLWEVGVGEIYMSIDLWISMDRVVVRLFFYPQGVVLSTLYTKQYG